MKFTKSNVVALMLAMGISGAAMAAGNSPTPPNAAMPKVQAGIQKFKDSDLQKFVDVQSGLQNVRKVYAGKLKNVKDPQKARQLQQEASRSMTQVLKNEGISVDTYTKIARAARSDKGLRQRIIKMMN